MRRFFAAALMFGMALPGSAGGAQEARPTPYWASISASEAMMRTGPGKNFPAVWLYRRADLPIKVLEVFPSWRKVQDPGGATGWMLVNLLSDTRTALVTGTEAQPIHEAPSASSPIRYRAEPGVVGRISKCAAGWCRFDVGGKRGHIRSDNLWGIDPGERLE